MTTDELRTRCHDLIDRMPDDGLEETLSTLRDYHAFYLTPKAEPAVVLPAREQGAER